MPVNWGTVGTVLGLACVTFLILYGLLLGGQLIKDAVKDIRRALGWW